MSIFEMSIFEQYIKPLIENQQWEIVILDDRNYHQIEFYLPDDDYHYYFEYWTVEIDNGIGELGYDIARTESTRRQEDVNIPLGYIQVRIALYPKA